MITRWAQGQVGVIAVTVDEEQRARIYLDRRNRPMLLLGEARHVGRSLMPIEGEVTLPRIGAFSSDDCMLYEQIEAQLPPAPVMPKLSGKVAARLKTGRDRVEQAAA